jgi:predicted adenine nucleotide alpha hydrolase (AANH) superfamily ATPase
LTTLKKKILVHACCTACASHAFKELEKAGFMPVAFYYSPQVGEESEYEKRCEDLSNFCGEGGYAIVTPEQNLNEFDSLVDPYKDHVSIKYISDKDRYRRRRCNICYTLTIQKTIEQAKKLRIKFFTTSLLCSPYKDHDEIVEIANEKALDYNMNFYYQDFRKGYWMGRNYARNHNVHIPTYCGCLESLKERRLE